MTSQSHLFICPACGGDPNESNHAARCQPVPVVPPRVFDLQEGLRRRSVGQANVSVATSDADKAALWSLWHGLCLTHQTLTSDHLWEAMPPDLKVRVSQHVNILGTMFTQSAKRKGWTADSGVTTKTRRATGQARRIVVWRSLIYR